MAKARDVSSKINPAARLKNNVPLEEITFLQQKTAEQQLLLTIIRNIASIRDKKDILRSIYPALKTLFHTEDIFICRLDKEEDAVVPFLRMAPEERQQNEAYAPVLQAHFPAKDRFFQPVFEFIEPVYFAYEDILQWPSPPVYSCIAYEAGLAEGISVQLRSGNEVVGVLTILSSDKGSFTEHHRHLLAQLADQISILVKNILDGELIREKERENNLLLSVSHAIATIRHKNDLVQAIQKTLQTTLQFSDLAITRFNLPKGTFQVYLESCEATNQHPDFNAIAFAEYPIEDGIHNLIRDSADTVFLKIDDLAKEGQVHIQFLQQAGIKELAGIRLQHNDSVIGTLVLLSTQEHSFPPADRRLIREVSHHFATAMVNLIYHEELQERSREKETLLSVSSAFAAIRRKEELMPVLQTQLDNLRFYNDLTIVLADANGKTFSGFLVNENSGRQKDKGYPQIRSAHHLYPDGIFEVAMESSEPVLFDLDEIMQRPNVPIYVRFLWQHGTVHLVGISLSFRGRKAGVLFLFSPRKKSFTPHQLKLMQGIGDQLATTIANIRSNEEIAKREQEKTVLLSFSEELARARHRDDLFRTIRSRFRALFRANGFGIGLVQADSQTYAPYLFDFDPDITAREDFRLLLANPLPFQDGLFNEVMTAGEPLFFRVADLPANADNPVMRFWKAAGMELVVGWALRVGEKGIGGFFLHLSMAEEESMRENLSLFKGVCSQLSTALSTIVANEKIVDQLAQINRYKEQLEEERTYLQKEVSSGYTYRDLVGTSPKMQAVFQLIAQVSNTNSTVLILGETGTGKELIARAIHNASTRNQGLLVKVNCAVLPANLVESELFGHERGSFTGAAERRIGKFELANNGTLFLDEVGELPADMQAKLLRAIQEREIERIGGKTTIKLNVRLIAATNRDLLQEVEAGRFRRDLYYRLNVFPVNLPPLRERKEDIPLLVAHFIEKYARNAGRKIQHISGKAMKELLAYSWPGNVRELEHLIERSVLLAEGDTIRRVHLPTNNKKEIEEVLQASYLKTFDENERDHILRVLNHCGGKIYGTGGAAEILGLRVSTLNSKMKKLGIKKNKQYL